MLVSRLVRARYLHCSCANRLLAMLVPCLLVIDDARACFVTRDPSTTTGSRNLPRSRRTATIGCGENVTGRGHWRLTAES